MRAYGVSASLTALVLQAGVWNLALSQDSSPFRVNPEFLAGAFEETEQLPQFQVEIIAFTYNAFDPTEEQFHRKARSAAERQASISESILSTLLALEEEPTPLDPFNLIDSVLDNMPDEPAEPLGAELGNELDLGGVQEQQEPPYDPLSPGGPGDPSTQRIDQDPRTEDLIAVGNNFELIDPLTPETATERLEEDRFQLRFLRGEELELTDESTRLDNLGAYTVLAHGGWVQEGLPEERAQPFNIGLLGTLNPLGTVQVHLSRFLHVTVELEYHARPNTPVPQQNVTYSDVLEEFSLPPVYELRTTRRTRSGELHYFDHPAFGLLVIVRPAPEEAEATDELLNPPLDPAA